MKLNGKVGQVGIKAAVGDFDNLAWQKKKIMFVTTGL